ncbi:MAG: hypothetical protein D3926_03685 [Desulfobacteraceae bacterium]|nr:MAG: hypothetical protein D3926_03685 [Desulfobacteraceae bacterium]
MFDEKIDQMLKRYDQHAVRDHENALKEIIQEIVLLGLWRSKFYERAVFYGGSALRILHNLDRFSENLDFSLVQPETRFNIEKYLFAVKYEIELWGFEVQTEKKHKKNKNAIDSAFIKANTLVHLMKIGSTLRINIKGRDWYDLLWFVKAKIPCNHGYLKNKMVQTGHLCIQEELNQAESVLSRTPYHS